jgi:hypothetical protein
MLNSGILDFVIGLIFTFLAVSLAAGAATEIVASALKWRSMTLVKGVKDLLNDKNFKALAAAVYQHGLINPRGDGSVPSLRQRWLKGPSYIEPNQFAAAFLDIIKGTAKIPNKVEAESIWATIKHFLRREKKEANPTQTNPAQTNPAQTNPAQTNPAQTNPAQTNPAQTNPQQQQMEQLKQAVNAKVKNNQINNMLHGIIERSQGDEEKIRKELSAWFDNAMDRVSGAYKRWAQLWSFVFALVIAILLNINTIEVAQSLWRQPIDTKEIAATTDKTALSETLRTLETLPIGWSKSDTLHAFFERPPSEWDWTRICGWFITAFAALFGAPFWFDALQQVIRLKGSGPSPAEKTAKTAAAN